ncbi:MAG TPA: NAD(P)H-dependent oxidoreductase [Treponema sp.]|nr:NAD(P)H-dependent oxidoreductase [Treponema sp.]
MIKTASVILAHPYKKSFNHAIFDTSVKTLTDLGVHVCAHDLYEESFNPVLTTEELGKQPTKDPLVSKYVQELIESDLLIFIHPNWWGQPPAILAGYVDRVIRPPHAYDFDPNDSSAAPWGKLTEKGALVFNTSNTDAARETGYFHDPLESLWGRCVFGFCGLENYSRRMFRIISESDDAQRKGWLAETAEIIKNFGDYPKK